MLLDDLSYPWADVPKCDDYDRPDVDPVPKLVRAVVAVSETGTHTLVSHHPRCEVLEEMLDEAKSLEHVFGTLDSPGVYLLTGKVEQCEDEFGWPDNHWDGTCEAILSRADIEQYTGEVPR